MEKGTAMDEGMKDAFYGILGRAMRLILELEITADEVIHRQTRITQIAAKGWVQAGE